MEELDESYNSDSNHNDSFYLNVSRIFQSVTKGSSSNVSANTEDRLLANEDFIVILGKKYNTLDSKEESESADNDIYTRIFSTYRVGFEAIPKAKDGPSPLSFMHSMIFIRNVLFTTLTKPSMLIDGNSFSTDVGWGCMIRTSQSLLANAIQKHILGREFVFDPINENPLHTSIIEMFNDNYDSCFSIHNFVKTASSSPLEVKPGQWFGPNAASLSIERLCNSSANLKKSNNLIAKLYENGDVFYKGFQEIFSNHKNSSLLLLIPVRLGLHEINPYYHDSILQLLRVSNSVGISGGKPSSSYYFFGYEGKKLLYLDPHHPQISNSDSVSYHTRSYSKLSIENMDPSMMIGLLVENMEDFNQLMDFCKTHDNKIIHFHDRECSVIKKDSTSSFELQKSDYINISENISQDSFNMVNLAEEKNQRSNEDEFVVLDADIEEIKAGAKSQDCLHAYPNSDLLDSP